MTQGPRVRGIRHARRMSLHWSTSKSHAKGPAMRPFWLAKALI